MPNIKVLKAAKERRRSQAAHSKRVYGGYADQVNQLIYNLNGSSPADQERALRLLTQMSFLIVPELLTALQDPALDTATIDQIVLLLGETSDENAREPLWEYYLEVCEEPNRASLAALSLAHLGEPRVLNFLRGELDCDDPERILNAVKALRYLGELEDVNRLRAIHRTSSNQGECTREIRKETVNSILAILDEVGGHSADRILEQIRGSFADRALWKDISAYTAYSY